MTAATRFNDLYQKAKKSRSKELRISIDLAEDLSTEIAGFAIEMVAVQRLVIQLQKELIQAKPTNISSGAEDMDGGGF